MLTDGCFPEADTYRGDASVQLEIIGKASDNVAITRFQVRRSLVDVIGYQILVEVINFGPDPVACRLEVMLENELTDEAGLVDVVPLKLDPNERWQQVLDHTSTTGGRMVATINVQDALAADNQAVALLPRRKRQPVLLVTAGNLFLQSALAAIPLVDLRVETSLPESRPAGTIVILDGQSPASIPTGNVMVMGPTAATDLWTMGEPVKDPIVAGQDNESPLLTNVQLENVVMLGARELDFQVKHKVLAASIGGQPLYTAIEHEAGKTLVMTVDLSQGDLPLRTAFPILMTNAIHWFRGERAELLPSFATGSVVEFELPGAAEAGERDSNGVHQALDHRLAVAGYTVEAPVASQGNGTKLVLRAPDGSEKRLPEDVSRLTIGPLDQCGVWQVVRTGADSGSAPTPSRNQPGVERLQPLAQYACNLANAAESDLRVTADGTAKEPVRAGSFGGRPIWFYLIMFGLLLSAIEWCMYQRRWIS